MEEPRWFAFLRAINTGTRRLTNDQLLAPFRELGLLDVSAYQAAGNVTFRAVPGTVDEAELEAALAAAYGFDAPTFLRSQTEIAAVAGAAPFAAGAIAATEGRVQVSFLRRVPTADAVAEVAALVPEGEHLAVIGREWYWLPAAGISTSRLPVSRVEGLVGAMTMRTLGTVRRMAARFG